MDDTTIVVDAPVVEPAAEPVVEPVAEPAIEEPVVEPVVEPAQEPSTEDGQGAPAVIEEPVVEPAQEPAEPQEPVVEPEAEPVVEPVAEPTPAEPAPQEPDQYAVLEAAHAELQARYDDLSAQFALLQATNEDLMTQITSLTEYRARIEDAEKDAMISKFYMLSDDDKKDIVANKAQYTVEEIEEKLSVLCFRNKVNFDLENTQNNNTGPAVTFDLSAGLGASKPAWIAAMDSIKNNKH